MRLATSALTATSGLLLLGLAIFGRPDLYLHEARHQLVALMPAASGDDEDPNANAITQQLNRLQQQVKQLKDQLAVRQATVDLTPPAAAPEAQPAPQSAPQPPPPPPPAPPPQATAPAPASAPPVAAPAPAAAPAMHIAAPPPPAAQSAAAQPAPAPAFVPPPVIIVPEHREAPRPAPTVAAPPRPRPEPPDDTQSVLARLRQRTTTVPQIVSTPPVVAQPDPQPVVRQRLAMARSAVLSGATEDAIHILQEVQLRLVFRPVSPDNAEPPPVGQSASDVAGALTALGGNDLRRGLQFIERAMTDASGANVASGPPPPAAPSDGYAPAYPPQ